MNWEPYYIKLFTAQNTVLFYGQSWYFIYLYKLTWIQNRILCQHVSLFHIKHTGYIYMKNLTASFCFVLTHSVTFHIKLMLFLRTWRLVCVKISLQCWPRKFQLTVCEVGGVMSTSRLKCHPGVKYLNRVQAPQLPSHNSTQYTFLIRDYRSTQATPFSI